MTKTIRTCDVCGADLSDKVKYYKLLGKRCVAANKTLEADWSGELCEDCYQTVMKAVKGDPYQKGEG